MKKKLLAGFAVGVMMAGMVDTASATPVFFDIAGATGGSSVTVTDTASRGDLTGTLAAGLDLNSFTLNDGETKTIDFFTLTATGAALNKNYSISAELGFDSPNIAAAGSGAGKFSTFFGILSGGTLAWDAATLPDLFIVNGNNISVNFEEGSRFGLGDTSMVHAYITNNGGGNAPVPEPATMLLMGTGLAGLIGARRKKRA
jgi:hypothetical protein